MYNYLGTYRDISIGDGSEGPDSSFWGSTSTSDEYTISRLSWQPDVGYFLCIPIIVIIEVIIAKKMVDKLDSLECENSQPKLQPVIEIVLTNVSVDNTTAEIAKAPLPSAPVKSPSPSPRVYPSSSTTTTADVPPPAYEAKYV